MAQTDGNPRNVINTVLVVMVGQVGCLSLVIILLSVLGGLWLDNTLHTKPLFTLILLLAGIPLSVVLMLYVGRRTIAKIKTQSKSEDDELSA